MSCRVPDNEVVVDKSLAVWQQSRSANTSTNMASGHRHFGNQADAHVRHSNDRGVAPDLPVQSADRRRHVRGRMDPPVHRPLRIREERSEVPRRSRQHAGRRASGRPRSGSSWSASSCRFGRTRDDPSLRSRAAGSEREIAVEKTRRRARPGHPRRATRTAVTRRCASRRVQRATTWSLVPEGGGRRRCVDVEGPRPISTVTVDNRPCRSSSGRRAPRVNRPRGRPHKSRPPRRCNRRCRVRSSRCSSRSVTRSSRTRASSVVEAMKMENELKSPQGRQGQSGRMSRRGRRSKPGKASSRWSSMPAT